MGKLVDQLEYYKSKGFTPKHPNLEYRANRFSSPRHKTGKTLSKLVNLTRLQARVSEYAGFGKSVDDIAEILDLDKSLVQSALEKTNKKFGH